MKTMFTVLIAILMIASAARVNAQGATNDSGQPSFSMEIGPVPTSGMVKVFADTRHDWNGFAKLVIYNERGQFVGSVPLEVKAGIIAATFELDRLLPNGNYIVVLYADGAEASAKIILLR